MSTVSIYVRFFEAERVVCCPLPWCWIAAIGARNHIRHFAQSLNNQIHSPVSTNRIYAVHWMSYEEVCACKIWSSTAKLFCITSHSALQLIPNKFEKTALKKSYKLNGHPHSTTLQYKMYEIPFDSKILKQRNRSISDVAFNWCGFLSVHTHIPLHLHLITSHCVLM